MFMNRRPLILLEFNELSPLLMERFLGTGCLPNFQRLHDTSQVYVTEAEERRWELNPWVQWVTLHSGLNYRDHGIAELDEATKLKAKRVWDVVSDAGMPVWVCGSMNVAYEPTVRGAILPDPWTTKVAPHPQALQPFFRFVQRNVLEHTNDKVPVTRADYAKFVAFMVSHGMSVGTVRAIVGQLLNERRHGSACRWKRALLLDRLQFDVFKWYYRKTRPQFATFFSNSTAHFQHFHWREMEPHLFKHQPTAEQLSAHENTILTGYQAMDALVGRFLRLAGPDAIVVFATALSQQPCLIYEDQGGKVLHRPANIARLMQFAGVTEPHTSAPLMAEVFNLQFQNDVDAARVQAKLRAIKVDDRPAMLVHRDGALVTTKCQIHEPVAPAARLVSGEGARAVPFFDLFYQIEDIRSGMHHPDGMLWIRTPGQAHRRYEEKVPLASVAPTLLQLMGLPAPSHMKAPPLPRVLGEAVAV
jgi:hypothetical protein